MKLLRGQEKHSRLKKRGITFTSIFLIAGLWWLQNYKVAVLGAAGGIGQPMSMLLKDVDGIKHLSLYDVQNTPGVAADLSHINTGAKVCALLVMFSMSLSPPAPLHSEARRLRTSLCADSFRISNMVLTTSSVAGVWP